MNRQSARSLATAFGWAFVVHVVVQVLGGAMFLGLHDWAYSVHSWLFGLTSEQFDLAAYSLLGFMKALGLTLFLVPWIALRITAAGLPE